jgi:hypothetical protein
MKSAIPQANMSIKLEPILDVQRVAAARQYTASPPLDVNVRCMMILATKMAFIGRD